MHSPEAKANLRQKARQQTVAPALRATESKSICSLLTGSPEIQAATYVGIFSPFLTEPDLRPLLEALPGKICFPKVEGSRLSFYLVRQLTELAPGYRQIPEPTANPARKIDWTERDLVLVPGLLFDRQGGRLGSGKGFYDRFFASLPVAPLKWGTCLSLFVERDALPQEPTDIRLNALALASGLLEF